MKLDNGYKTAVAAVVALVCVSGSTSYGRGQKVGDLNPQETRAGNKRLDKYGDPLPAGAIARLGTRRLRHREWVEAIAFSPDGSAIASGGDREQTIVWHVSTGKMLHCLTQGRAKAMAFSPDSKTLATRADEGITVWDVTTGNELSDMTEAAEWIEMEEKIQGEGSTALSADGKFVAEGREGGLIRVWNIDSNETVFASGPRERDEGYCRSTAFSRDGRFVASAWDGWGGGIFIVNLKTGEELRIEHTLVATLAFSPDSKVLASGDYDGRIRFWNPINGKEVFTVRSHWRGVKEIVFSPDGQTIITTDAEGSVNFWEPTTGDHHRMLRRPEGAISANGRLLASRSKDHSVIVQEVATGKVLHTLRGHEDWIDLVAFGPDGKTLVTADRKNVLRAWDAISGKEIRKIDLKGRGVEIMAFSPERTILAFASSGARTIMDERGVHKGPYTPVTLLEIATGKEVVKFETKGDGLACLAFSADGRLVASGHGDPHGGLFVDGPRVSSSPPKCSRTVRLWDLRTGKQVASFKHPYEVFSVAFSGGGSIVASGTEDGMIYLWDTSMSAGQPLSKWAGHGWQARNRHRYPSGIERGEVKALAFSPDGALVVSGSRDGTALVWDVRALIGQERSAGKTGKQPSRRTEPPRTMTPSGTGRSPFLVPDDYDTIQAAIVASEDGDTITVARGRYRENINFLGKAITVRSTKPEDPTVVAATIIDGQGDDSVVNFLSGEDSNSILDGFTITNGSAGSGGGICCEIWAGPVISKCVITGNTASGGGGIHGCQGPILKCRITDNSARESGGGLRECTGPITNCTISNNDSAGEGGALAKCGGPIRNCMITDNSAVTEGNALMETTGPLISCTVAGNTGADRPRVGSTINCIVWGNSPGGVYEWAKPTYSCVEGGVEGMGNICVDPMFADPNAGDYHLRPGSPCINAGAPDFATEPGETDIDGDARIHAGRVDMGADEHIGAPSASTGGEHNISEPRLRKLRDPVAFVKAEEGLPFSTYQAARLSGMKDKLPQLYEMLQDPDYASDWHVVAKTICCVSDGNDVQSLPAVMEYFQRDDVWNFTDVRKLGGKVGVMSYLGLIEDNPQADAILRKAVTEEGAVELAKNWIHKGWKVAESEGWSTSKLVIHMIRGNACRGMGRSGKPEDFDFLKKLVAEQADYLRKNPSAPEGAGPYGSIIDHIIDGLAIQALMADVGRDVYLSANDVHKLSSMMRPYIRKTSKEVDEALSAADPDAEQVELSDAPAGPTRTEGISGNAYSFDGEGDCIDIGNDPSIQTEVFTIAAWINTDDTEAGWQTILSYETGSHAVSVLPNGRVHYGWQGIKRGLEGTSEVRTGKWVFAAVTRDSDYRACVYVNGELEGSFVDDTRSSFARRARIGGDAVDGEYFHGSIDEVAIFNRPLSGEAIRRLYHNPGSLTGNEWQLVGYWNFDADEGDIVKDSSSNGNHGRPGDLKDIPAPAPPAPPSIPEDHTVTVSPASSWTDGQAEFTLSVTGGRNNEPFIATITIENLTDAALSFPTPMVMPLAGDTNKNNIRVYDASGKELDIDGRHGDFRRRPVTNIGPQSSKSWQFNFNDKFPATKEPGRYRVELWYFTDESGPGAWTGRVRMEPVMIERLEAATSSWTDGKAEFTLSVASGRDNEPFIATITIANLTDAPLSFPKPMVMPLAGDTNKNNIRVYDSFGERLEMTGVHADFFRHPFTEIAPHSSESWQFTLEENFPGLSKPGRYKVEMWYFCDGGHPAAWTGRVRMKPVLIERGPVPDMGTGRQGYLTPASSVAATDDHKSIIISGINLKFDVPQRWTTWYNEFKDNFHLSRQELDSVMQAEGEWDFEFATLVNSILPFQDCAAHVGGESWGKDSISFADVQLRVYLFAGHPENIEGDVRAMSTQRPSNVFGRGHAAYDESFALERDSGSLWRKTRISYGAAYGDYGSTAHIDFRLRQFGSTAAAFVFMYTDHKDQQGTINQILGSVVCPYDSETVDTGEQTDPQAAWHNKFCDLRDFVKHQWHDGVPFYEAARRCITKDELPQLYRMLQDKDWAPYWHIIAKTIGYVSFEADSVEGDEESTAVLLDYFERDEVWNFTHVEKVSGKVRALGWIGLSGGPEADLVLRKAVTKEGALELAKNWINQEWEFPDSTAWSETEYLVNIIRGEAFKGLVWTGKPENIERVEKLWSEQQAYVRDYPDLVTAFDMRVYNKLCDAVSYRDAIADRGYETFFCTLGDPTERYELVEPYIRKRQQAQAQPVIDERLRDPAEFVKQDWDWYGGVSFYEAARRCITKDKLPLLYEMLQDRNYAAHWHRIARTICFASDRDDAANSVGVLLDYLQRDDVWNLTDSGKIMGKVGVMCLMGIIGGPEVDSVLRKAVTLEGAAELVKNWIDKKRPIVPESDSWNRAEFVRTMIRGEASRGLGLTGDPANNEFLWKLVAEQRDWYKENPDYTVTYSDKDQEASPCGTFWDSVIDGLANYALVAEMGRREAYLIMGNHEALDAKLGPHSRRLAREVREMLRGGNANAEPVEHTGTPAGPTQVAGISGTAYYFDGEEDFININDSESLDITGNEITVSAWIKPEKIDGRQVIVAKTAGGDNTWLVEINPVDFSPGTINFYMDIEGMDGNFGGSRPVQVGRWHHVACVYDGDQRVIYIDGRFDASQAVSGSLQTNDQPVRIGSWGSLSRFFHGTIDEVLIYSRALSAREIQELHQRVDRAGDNKVGLVGYWSFNADEEGIVKDSSGHHNHGRLNNGRQTLGVRIPARRSSSRTDGRVEFALAAEGGVGDKRMIPAIAIENGAGSELVDLYGDSLPTGAIARLGTRRLRHMDEAASVAFSPDGKTIASAGGGEGVVAVWETATGKKLHWLIGHSHGADAVAFAANGKMLASGSGSTGQVILWDPIGGTKLRELEHDCSVFSLTLSPDCNVLAAVSGYSRTTGRLRGRGRIYLWDPATGINTLTIVEPGAYWAAFTPDAARIISASQNRNSSRVAVWDTGTGEEIRAFDDSKICSVGLSPDGKTLAAGYEDGSVRVWDVDSGATSFELAAPGSDSRSAEQVVFSPNGRVLALAIDAGRNSILRAIEVETGKELWTGKMRVRSVAFSPDGRMLASCSHDGRIRLWNATDGQEITKAPSHYRQVQLAAFSADGQRVTTKAKDGTVRTWGTTGGGQQSMFNVVVPYWNDALSDDGLLLATIDEDKQF